MIKDFYKQLFRIRRFEETLLNLFSENKLNGTTHTCIGQEAIAVSVMNNATENDFIFSNHRCHGHFIAYCNEINPLLAEIMGKEDGVCKGYGGSQHLCYKKFFSNGIQGGIVPNAVGLAFAQKIKSENGITIVFIGDGTLGQGVVYESFNIASLNSVPILFVIENNQYAMSTSKSEGVAGSIKDRTVAFGIETNEISTNDTEELNHAFKKATQYVRKNKKPFCQVINTYRLAPHSKGDDFRDGNEIKKNWGNDPLKLIEAKLSREIISKIKDEVEKEIKAAVDECESYKISDSLPKDIVLLNKKSHSSVMSDTSDKACFAINAALDSVMKKDKSVVILGEDIRDPYGGAFKVTKGLSEKYGDRVLNMPISEAGFTGCAVGMAMNGLKPIVEIMFGDFISLGFDQILNHATKYNAMYAGKVNVPMLIRIPSGGGRGYGATHSQSLEKYLIGIPHLNVFALSLVQNQKRLIETIMENIISPTILVENKKMYAEKTFEIKNNKFKNFYIEESNDLYPVYKISLDKDEKAEITLITYGGTTQLAMDIAEKLLFEDEIIANVIVNTSLSPLNIETITKYIDSTKNICTLEEGTEVLCVGSEIITKLSEKLYGRNYKRIATKNTIIPVAQNIEKEILPNLEDSLKILKGWYLDVN